MTYISIVGKNVRHADILAPLENTDAWNNRAAVVSMDSIVGNKC